MGLEEIKTIKEKLIDLIKKDELGYFEDEKLYDEIINKSREFDRKYISLYSQMHKSYNRDILLMKKELNTDLVWKLIIQLSENNKKLKSYFNTKYSIEEISQQLKELCEYDATLPNLLQHFQTCQKCKKKITELENPIRFNNKMAADDIKNNLIIKMQDSSIVSSFLSEDIISKYNSFVEGSEKKIESLCRFFNGLNEVDRLKFLELLVKFFEGKMIGIISIYDVLKSLNTKQNKFNSVTQLLDSLKKEISKLQKERKKTDLKMEWIFQL